jgi:hypothetical protein
MRRPKLTKLCRQPARDAAEADRDHLAVEIVEARAAAGQRAAAEAERDRLVVELSQARQAVADVERRTIAADAAPAPPLN